MANFFDDVKEGLREALDHEKGKIALRKKTVLMPKPSVKYAAKEKVSFGGDRQSEANYF